MEDLKKLFKKYNADAILLQNCDDFTFQHSENSLLHKITGFLGTAGEAVVTKNGEIFLFVDPRYHIQAEKSAKQGVNVIKMQMKERFTEVLKKYIREDSTLLVDEKFITLPFFEKLQKTFKNLVSADFVQRCAPIVTKGKIDNKKIEKLKKKFEKYKAENILITNVDDVSFLTGLKSFEMPYSSAIRAKLLINKKNTLIFENLKEIKGKTVLFKEGLALCDFKKVKNPVLLDKNFVANMASIKTAGEIRELQDSFARLDEALFAFRSKIKVGLSEFELKRIFECELFKTGANALSFKTILSIGENTASIHYSNWDKKKILKENDLILLDCGGYWKSPLATDITRVFTGGRPNDEQKKVYTWVLKAFLSVYNSNLESGYELDALARKIFRKANLKGFNFPHALGHGIGVNVHSAPPAISPSDTKKKKLKKNMTFTIEPGLYMENKFGIRLENTVFVNKEGRKQSFSRFPFEQSLIDFSLLTSKEKRYLAEWQNGR